MHKDAVDPLLDLLDFCAEIQLFARGRDTGDDELERMRYLAIERLFELLGETIKRALSADQSLASELPDAHRIVSMRNRLAHEYDNIDLDTLWEAADEHVPALAMQVANLLRVNGVVLRLD